MQVLRYNEAANTETLERLPAQLRVAFALLCAIRILPSYERFHSRTGRGDPGALNALSDRLWQDITGDPMTEAEVQLAIDRATRLVPTEDNGWDQETQPYAEDAAAALTYALRTRLTGDAQEAAWASRRVYESADHFVIALTGITPDTSSQELEVMTHPVVQNELARQRRDLRELTDLAALVPHDARVMQMRRRSEEESLAFFRASS
jgi:uncharacterized protein YjaG (DUF416 family)